MNAIELTAELPPPGKRPPRPVRLDLPAGAVERTQEELRALSAGCREALVLWAGRPSGSCTATVTHLIALDCEASRLRLVVPMQERIAALGFVRAHELLVFADLHTHPREAFLSDADRARPFAVRDGFYAIVVPNFAEGPALSGWAIYEAVARDWEEVPVRGRITG